MGMQVWMRAGDAGDYEPFDSMFDAGSDLGNYLGVLEVLDSPRSLTVTKRGNYGVVVPPSFTGYNYVSLFWGDEDAQPEKPLTQADITDFKRGIRDTLALYSTPPPATSRGKKKSARSSIKRKSTGSAMKGLRG